MDHRVFSSASVYRWFNMQSKISISYMYHCNDGIRFLYYTDVNMCFDKVYINAIWINLSSMTVHRWFNMREFNCITRASYMWLNYYNHAMPIYVTLYHIINNPAITFSSAHVHRWAIARPPHPLQLKIIPLTASALRMCIAMCRTTNAIIITLSTSGTCAHTLASPCLPWVILNVSSLQHMCIGDQIFGDVMRVVDKDTTDPLSYDAAAGLGKTA